MERLQAPPSVMVWVRDLLAIMTDVLAIIFFASRVLPQELQRAILRSVESEQQHSEPTSVMAFLIREHVVMLDTRWWHLWVALILHVKDCTASECPCILYPDCQRYRQQRPHLQSCNEMGCQLPECARIKALLLHYENCADHSICDLCDEVNISLKLWKTYTELQRFEDGYEPGVEERYHH